MRGRGQPAGIAAAGGQLSAEALAGPGAAPEDEQPRGEAVRAGAESSAALARCAVRR